MDLQTNPREPYEKLLDFFKVLGSMERLKIAGLLAQRPATVVELARALDLRETDVAHHLARLEELGLVHAVSAGSQAYAFDEGALLRLKKGVFQSRRARRMQAAGRDWEQKLLDTFVVEGRLMGIPAQHKRRVAITKWLAARFETGVRYSEKEVNEIIQRVHHDSSSLRRYMIDYGFMQRDHGVYWRVRPEPRDAQPVVEGVMSQPEFDQLLRFFKALGNESRLKIVGILANREATVGDLADLLELREPTVSHHLAALKELGLVHMWAEGNAHVYALDEGALIDLKKDVFSRDGMASLVRDVDAASWKKKVLQTFVIDDRLTQIPAQRKKQLVVLQWLARKFERGVRYPERELNEIIKQVHPDTASLRRALVGWKFMAREGGVYWRVPETEQLRALTAELTSDENVLEVLRGE